MNTLIVSDLHLGARNSRTDLIAELLEGDFDRLVLNGDTVDSPDLRRFRPCDWRIIDALRAVGAGAGSWCAATTTCRPTATRPAPPAC